jgi:hypothetical protein
MYAAAPPSRMLGGLGIYRVVPPSKRWRAATGMRLVDRVRRGWACSWLCCLPGGEEDLGVGRAVPPRLT